MRRRSNLFTSKTERVYDENNNGIPTHNIEKQPKKNRLKNVFIEFREVNICDISISWL